MSSACIATNILEVRSYRGMGCSCSLDSELDLPNRVGLLRFYPVVLRGWDGSCRKSSSDALGLAEIRRHWFGFRWNPDFFKLYNHRGLFPVIAGSTQGYPDSMRFFPGVVVPVGTGFQTGTHWGYIPGQCELGLTIVSLYMQLPKFDKRLLSRFSFHSEIRLRWESVEIIALSEDNDFFTVWVVALNQILNIICTIYNRISVNINIQKFR